MSDLINRQDAIYALTEANLKSHMDSVEAGQENRSAIRIIMELPSAERKRGEWIDGLDVPKEEREKHPYVYLHGDKYCSVCYKEAYFDTDYGQQLFDYCPNCGARMVSI